MLTTAQKLASDEDWRNFNGDPYAGKPMLWGKHCRRSGCDDFNEQHPRCWCPCSACQKTPADALASLSRPVPR